MGTHIPKNVCFPGRISHITTYMYFQDRRTHVTKNVCFPGREHISLVICVSLVGERIALGICVSLLDTNH